MSKMFYTAAEAMEKLHASESQLRVLVSEGRLREFRDGSRSMFKADQVDTLVGLPSPVSDRADDSTQSFTSPPEVDDSTTERIKSLKDEVERLNALATSLRELGFEVTFSTLPRSVHESQLMSVAIVKRTVY
jgi:hypothetical protein